MIIIKLDIYSWHAELNLSSLAKILKALASHYIINVCFIRMALKTALHATNKIFCILHQKDGGKLFRKKYKSCSKKTRSVGYEV